MQTQIATPPDPGFRPAAFGSKFAAPAHHALQAPRRNLLLAALPRSDYDRLLPHLESVSMPAGWSFRGAGARDKYLYFPVAGIVSLRHALASGATMEYALVGSEGAIGVASVLGGAGSTGEAVVLSAGHAYRLPVARLESECRSDSVLFMLLRYTQALIAQIGQLAGCNQYHAVRSRVCTWLLSCLDRLPSNELKITQEMIADTLGVRRESVTQAIGSLQRAGLLRCGRGRIVVLDRAGLEAQACECYAVVKREYERMFDEVRPLEFTA